MAPVRTLIVITGLVAAALPLLAQSQAPPSTGPLGPVNALGQEVPRPPVYTGPAPRLPDGTIDLNGLWVGTPNDLAQTYRTQVGGELPMLPSARAIVDARKKKEAEDPYLWCLPQGVPRSTPYPFRFVPNYTHKAPTHLFLLYEGNIHTYRQIFMDGRTHPAELDPTWFGHSIGRWQKDTLVIDTVGFNDRFWFDRQGTPHTEQLHIIERWERPDLGRLVNTVTLEDPGTFSRPVTVTFTARLAAPGDELMEYICQENNQFGAAAGIANPFNK